MRSAAGERRVSRLAQQAVTRVFDRLDYAALGGVYCYEGGEQFWRAKRIPCRRLGLRVSSALTTRLKPGGSSLYVGAGVAELPPLLMETIDLHRRVSPHNLRRREVTALNRACVGVSVRFRREDAATAGGRYDHLWIVSVLNDPERFPQLSALSYGRANPVSFHPATFERERWAVLKLVDRCMAKLTVPGLVTTSTEEVVWIAAWCHRMRIPYQVERRAYPTALVGDPICFIRIGRKKRMKAAKRPHESPRS